MDSQIINATHLGTGSDAVCKTSPLAVTKTTQDIAACDCPMCLWGVAGQLQVQLAQVLRRTQEVEHSRRVVVVKRGVK